MTETTTQLRQTNPEENDSMAKLEEPDGDVYGYLSREVADQLGEFMELTISEEAEVMAQLDGVTGSGSGNFGRFETPGGAVVGFGVANDLWSEVIGEEVERDDDGNVTNAPSAIGLTFSSSDEESYEDAESADEEEVEALIAGSGSESDGSEGEEEEVEIADEEIGLVGDDE